MYKFDHGAPYTSRLVPFGQGVLGAAGERHVTTTDREIEAVILRDADRARSEHRAPATRRPLLRRRGRRGTRSAA